MKGYRMFVGGLPPVAVLSVDTGQAGRSYYFLIDKSNKTEKKMYIYIYFVSMATHKV